METVKSQWLPGVGGREREWVEHKGVLRSETILHDATLVGTSHYTAVKTHRMFPTKREP